MKLWESGADSAAGCSQGIELQNPNARGSDADADMKSGTESYFSEYSGFRSLTLPAPKK